MRQTACVPDGAVLLHNTICLRYCELLYAQDQDGEVRVPRVLNQRRIPVLKKAAPHVNTPELLAPFPPVGKAPAPHAAQRVPGEGPNEMHADTQQQRPRVYFVQVQGDRIDWKEMHRARLRHGVWQGGARVSRMRFVGTAHLLRREVPAYSEGLAQALR